MACDLFGGGVLVHCTVSILSSQQNTSECLGSPLRKGIKMPQNSWLAWGDARQASK